MRQHYSVPAGLVCIGMCLNLPHHEQNAVQSRVRRLIGRRRGGGLDRYIGVLQREAGQAQDSVDPITELLSQLSGEGQRKGSGRAVWACTWRMRGCPDSVVLAGPAELPLVWTG